MSFWNDTSEAFAAEHARKGDPWEKSKHKWMRTLSSSAKGALGERMVSAFARHKGAVVGKVRAKGSDRTISGVAVEIKFSMLWSTNTYCFQQIRDQNYAFAVLFGVSPGATHLWVVPKSVLWAHTAPQHGGASGRDTRWLSFDPLDPPAWLAPFGGVADEGGLGESVFCRTFGLEDVAA